jgi:diguanylate cyclase (GGDEF)-like protein
MDIKNDSRFEELFTQGKTALKASDLLKAADLLEQALKIAALPEQQSRCQLALSESYERQGNLELAIHYLKSYCGIKKQLDTPAPLPVEKAPEVPAPAANPTTTLHSLVGLDNLMDQHTFTDAVRRELALTFSPNQRPVTLLVIDVDDLEQINEKYGRATGDQVLVAAANVICANLRGADRVARSGDDFWVLLADTVVERGERVAERIHKRFASQPLQTSAGPLSVSLSVGFSGQSMHGRGPDTFDKLLAEANHILQQAKQAKY